MNKIKQTLKELGIMPNVKGYHYLATAIEMVANDFRKKETVYSWIGLYRIIANKHNDTSGNNVERCIRKAIYDAVEARTELFDKLFLTNNHSNSAFIAIVAEYIVEEEK